MTNLNEVVHVWRNSVNGMVSLRACRASLCGEELKQHLALNVTVATHYVLRLRPVVRIHSVAAVVYGLYAQTQSAVAHSIKLHGGESERSFTARSNVKVADALLTKFVLAVVESECKTVNRRHTEILEVTEDVHHLTCPCVFRHIGGTQSYVMLRHVAAKRGKQRSAVRSVILSPRSVLIENILTIAHQGVAVTSILGSIQGVTDT